MAGRPVSRPEGLINGLNGLWNSGATFIRKTDRGVQDLLKTYGQEHDGRMLCANFEGLLKGPALWLKFLGSLLRSNLVT